MISIKAGILDQDTFQRITLDPQLHRNIIREEQQGLCFEFEFTYLYSEPDQMVFLLKKVGSLQGVGTLQEAVEMGKVALIISDLVEKKFLTEVIEPISKGGVYA